MWLCRCVDRVSGTMCWAEEQQARQVGAERWTSLEHEHLVKLTFFSRQCGGGAVPPSACQLPVRKVARWRAFGLPPGLCEAP